MSLQNPQVLLAKQAIYDKNHVLYGFELLFRNPSNLTAMEVGEDIATSEVLVSYCTSVSNETERSDCPVFINISESFLLSDAFLPIDKNSVVIELLERITVTDALIRKVQLWSKRGYRFALDDFDFTDQWLPILPYVSFIKVDVLDASFEDIQARKNAFDHLKVTWLAERIEDRAMLEKCIDLGFELFQGYYLARPKKVLGNSIRGSSAVTAQIIKTANQPDSSIDELADLVSHDPKLSMQLLKLINSSMFTLPRAISDLKEAIGFLGIDLLKRWAVMIAFVADASAPIEASRIVLARAKCSELYLESLNPAKNKSASAFLAGLLSGVDVLLELEPKYFIEQLSLDNEIEQAVMNHTGEMGQLVKEIQEIEFNLSQCPEKIRELNPDLLGCYSHAQRWSDEIIDTLIANKA